MTDPTKFSEAVQLVFGGSIGTLVLAFLARFAKRRFVEEGAAEQRAGGESDIIEQLRREVDRLATLNERLSLRIGGLQQEIIDLRGENISLMGELQQLRAELGAIRQRESHGV